MTTQERKEQRNKVKASESLIKTGCNRILKKIEDIRQKFSTAQVNGTRSGSSRIVLKHFDLLKINYGGAPAAIKIPSCIDSSSVNDNAGTYFPTESKLYGDDEFSDNKLERNQYKILRIMMILSIWR